MCIAKDLSPYAHAISRVLENHILHVSAKSELCKYSYIRDLSLNVPVDLSHLLTFGQTTQDKKLPALYLLDSIIKNIGSPYTTILGANIYRTFMEAYLAVPGSVRKKLDDMAKTWNYPVPQSTDNKPVFSKETMRPIETALIKARTMALKSQRQQQNVNPYNNMNGAQFSTTPQTQWRNTATPPQHNGHYHPPSALPEYVQGNGFAQVCSPAPSLRCLI